MYCPKRDWMSKISYMLSNLLYRSQKFWRSPCSSKVSRSRWYQKRTWCTSCCIPRQRLGGGVNLSQQICCASLKKFSLRSWKNGGNFFYFKSDKASLILVSIRIKYDSLHCLDYLFYKHNAYKHRMSQILKKVEHILNIIYRLNFYWGLIWSTNICKFQYIL